MERRIEILFFIFASFVIPCLLLFNVCASAQSTANKSIWSLPELYEKAKNSVVQIEVLEPTLNSTFEDMQFDAGFVYDKEGHIVTSSGAVPNEEDLIVSFLDGTVYNATLIGSDYFSDLAVLSIHDISQDKLIPLPLGNSSELDVGEQVAAIGNPFGISGVLTEGAIGRLEVGIPFEEDDEQTPSYLGIPSILTDVPINPGNAGGPLFNVRGEVVGINNAVYSSTGEFAGISFAVPSNAIKKIVPSLIAVGFYSHPWIGIEGRDITPQIAEAMGQSDTSGFLVENTVPGGPAATAGIRGDGTNTTVIVEGEEIGIGGDIIVGIDGHTVRTIGDIVTYLEREKEAGESVGLSVLGPDRLNREVEVDLGQIPDIKSSTPIDAPEDDFSLQDPSNMSGATVPTDSELPPVPSSPPP
jgi:S1-C subfamily serine protease